MLTHDFLDEFKCATEEKWSKCSINPTLYGFQFQRGTRWNPGLSDEKITEYENALGVRFPHDFRSFLQSANGTDLPTINVYAHYGEPHRRSIGVYSYSRDIEAVKQRIEGVRQERTELQKTMAEQGFVLAPEDALVPVYRHRYVVCTSNLDSSVVLSIADEGDAIVYGNSLSEYLEREFMRGSF